MFVFLDERQNSKVWRDMSRDENKRKVGKNQGILVERVSKIDKFIYYFEGFEATTKPEKCYENLQLMKKLNRAIMPHILKV